MRLLGIDLGTTNTVAASAGRPVPVSFENDRPTLPSVVSFLPNGTSLTGTAAKRRRSIDSPNTIFSANIAPVAPVKTEQGASNLVSWAPHPNPPPLVFPPLCSTPLIGALEPTSFDTVLISGLQNLLQHIKPEPKVVGIEEAVPPDVLKTPKILLRTLRDFPQNELSIRTSHREMPALPVALGSPRHLHQERSPAPGEIRQQFRIQDRPEIVTVGHEGILYPLC